MLPTIAGIPTHGLFVGLGVLAAVVVFVHEARRRGHTDDRLLIVVTGALVGGALFMRLGTWLQHVDLRDNASIAEQWAYGNRSILGGLVGAWLGVHVAKRLCGYRLRTGDLFAPAVALGMAVGRIGCFLTEPLPSTGGYNASFLYESAFHLVAFAVIWFWLRRLHAPAGGDLRLVRRGVRRLPLPGRVRARQRGRVARADPATAVPRRDHPTRAAADPAAGAVRRLPRPSGRPTRRCTSEHTHRPRDAAARRPHPPLRERVLPAVPRGAARPPARRGAAALRLAGRARGPDLAGAGLRHATAWCARCTTSRRRS